MTSTLFLVLSLALLVAIVAGLAFARRATLLLTAKYLLKRRLAWVSLAAVALCVALVLIVLSVMSGWLSQFRSSFKTLTGDLIVSRGSISNFGYYDEMIARITKLPEVEAAVPLIRTAGLLAIPTGSGEWTDYVGVVGMPPLDQVQRVMAFRESLWLQNDVANFNTSHKPVRDVASFDLYADVPYAELAPGDKRALQRPTVIVGAGAIGVHVDRITRKPEWPDSLNLLSARLTVVPTGEELGGASSQINATTTAYWIIDGSRTQAPQHDNNIYVPFAQLQKDLHLTAYRYQKVGSDEWFTEPAKTTEIQIKLKPGADAQAMKAPIRAIVRAIMREHSAAPATEPADDLADATQPATDDGLTLELGKVDVLTWDEQPREQKFLSAVENEITIMMTLFGVISLVAAFNIFCIFYTVVTEKTRDIGILKSVGASAWNVAQIFLSYGAAIGVVGGGMGVALGWAFVRYINEINGYITRITGREIYSSDVYAIDRLPNHVDPRVAITIWVIGVFAAIIGATLPAIRAARMNPVESLRFE